MSIDIPVAVLISDNIFTPPPEGYIFTFYDGINHWLIIRKGTLLHWGFYINKESFLSEKSIFDGSSGEEIILEEGEWSFGQSCRPAATIITLKPGVQLDTDITLLDDIHATSDLFIPFSEMGYLTFSDIPVLPDHLNRIASKQVLRK